MQNLDFWARATSLATAALAEQGLDLAGFAWRFEEFGRAEVESEAHPTNGPTGFVAEVTGYVDHENREVVLGTMEPDLASESSVREYLEQTNRTDEDESELDAVVRWITRSVGEVAQRGGAR